MLIKITTIAAIACAGFAIAGTQIKTPLFIDFERTSLTHGIKLEAHAINQPVDDATLFVASMFADPTVTKPTSFATAVVEVDGADHQMSFDSDSNTWSWMARPGWTRSIESVKLKTYAADGQYVFGGGIEFDR